MHGHFITSSQVTPLTVVTLGHWLGKEPSLLYYSFVLAAASELKWHLRLYSATTTTFKIAAMCSHAVTSTMMHHPHARWPTQAVVHFALPWLLYCQHSHPYRHTVMAKGMTWTHGIYGLAPSSQVAPPF